MCLLHDIFNVVRHINDPPRKRKKNRIRFYCCRIFIALGGWVLLLLLCFAFAPLANLLFSVVVLNFQFLVLVPPTAHRPPFTTQNFSTKKNYSNSNYNNAHTHYTTLHLLTHFIILRFLVVVPCVGKMKYDQSCIQNLWQNETYEIMNDL